MRAIDITIGVGWAVFWLYWFAAAASAKVATTRSARGVGARVAIFILILVLFRVDPVRGHGVTTQPPLAAVGVAAFVLGLALAVWARVCLGRNWGMPMSEKQEPELVTTGPYRIIRHPIYSGLILAMIGTAVAISPYWLAPAVLLSGYFVYSAVMEERTLSMTFPDAYSRYRRATKMLIPFVL